jgi:hypothetical protein
MARGAISPSVEQRLVSGDGSAHEEARLRQRMPAGATASGEALLVRVGAKFTTAFRSVDEGRHATWIVSHGPVLLASSQAIAARANGRAAARVIRAAARQVVERARLDVLRGSGCPVVGTAGIARAVITLGSAGGSTLTADQLHGATDRLALAWLEETKEGRPTPSVEQMMIGAAVLGAVLECVGAGEIEAQVQVVVAGALDWE